jgi:hypothetical protein
MWYLESNRDKGERISHTFETQEAAESHLERLGAIISGHYRVVADTGNVSIDRMLTEGLKQGDLYHILLPRISVDEYVPADPETDNIVIGFFIKGVPDAVLPFKSFMEKSNGVLNVDYGDSDTIVNTSVVYSEFDRENLTVDDIHAIMIQASMMAELEPEDFTMTFPHNNKKFPYDPQLLAHYFQSRNEQKNRMAQQKAEMQAKQEFERDLNKARRKQQQKEEPVEESLIDALVNVSLTG